MNLWKLFGLEKQHQTADLGKLFTNIETIVATGDEQRIKRITAVAGLLGKVAYADMTISAVEVEKIQRVLTDELSLTTSDVDAIVTLLKENSVQLLTLEDYIYLRLVNEFADNAQKKALMRTLFSVAAADESINTEEDNSLAIIAKGLLLSHREYISVRSEFKQHLDVLKKRT